MVLKNNEKEKGEDKAPGKGDSSSEGTVVKEPQKPPAKKRLLRPKSKRLKQESINLDSVTQVWGQAEKRGRGRPPTTGEYREIAEAKKAVNDERERELRLAMEARTYNMEETLAILRKSHLDPEETAEGATLDPTADLASRIREAQAEVVRVSKISSHLQGPLQRTLRAAASLTIDLTAVLWTRADGTAETTGSEELRRLREQVAKLISEQEKTNATIQTMREEMTKANEAAEMARQKTKAVRQELQDAIRRNNELKQKLRDEKERAETLMRETTTKQRRKEAEPMDVEIVPFIQEERPLWTHLSSTPQNDRPSES